MGVDIQAVAVAVYQYYYWADPELGAKVARIVNEEFVEATGRYPGRFLPLGTVPLQDTEAAIQELRYLATELGMRGIEIGTHVEGEEISSPRLAPFWAEVEALDLLVVVHTQGATHPQRLADHNFVNIVGHAFEATLAEVIQRDEQDRTRAVAPLRQADDAIVVDTSDMTMDEVVGTMVGAVRAVEGRRS